MADKNIVMDRADMLRDVHGWSDAEIQGAGPDGFVGEKEVEGVGMVKYFLTARGNVAIPNQMGDY